MTEALNEDRRRPFRFRVRYVPTGSIDPYCYITWSAGRTRFSYYEQLFKHKWSGIKEQNPHPAAFIVWFFLLIISFLALAKFLPYRCLLPWPRTHLKLRCVPLSIIQADALTFTAEEFTTLAWRSGSAGSFLIDIRRRESAARQSLNVWTRKKFIIEHYNMHIR